MASDHIKLEIRPDQKHRPSSDTAGLSESQGMTTIEVMGNHLRVDGYYDNGKPWMANAILTDLQLQALRGTAGKLPFRPTPLGGDPQPPRPPDR